tara:strand:+ start:216 stop:446 length:231 start_codon:yes stop_codon:yes gene_type:complete
MVIKPKDVRLKEVLFEMKQVGQYMRITAIDPLSGTEVISIGDSSVDPDMLRSMAIRKLKYVIAKNRNERAANLNEY